MMRIAASKQRGLSLVELMVASTVAFIVAGAMVMLFVNTKETYNLTENMARLQENGRFATYLLSQDLRMADYRACLADGPLETAIAGQNDTGTYNADTVTLEYRANACDEADSVVTTVYSLDTGASGDPALFRAVNGGAATELVEGIADLQIRYGADTDGDNVPNYYVDAGSIADWTQVIAVRFALTAATREAFQLSGQVDPDTDEQVPAASLTRAFASTVVLRNRLP